jgi:hypothetical protein
MRFERVKIFEKLQKVLELNEINEVALANIYGHTLWSILVST